MTVGIDEVGRGSLAGPLVAGAVVLPAGFHKRRGNLVLKDSKLLNRKQRTLWDAHIRRQALAIGLGWVWPDEIDEIGLTEAVRKAMQLALAAISCDYDEIIMDGNINYLANLPQTGPSCLAKVSAIIKADNTVPAVSAASIVAKVARDNYMATEAHRQFPNYAFDQHVGYGTPEHLKALRQYGICQIHRRSYEPIRILSGATA